ncbi:cytochrome P450 [Auricularia subglabra TFB-10046 SS5]|nr:cytochrome P450 [Auricularia subglabra TFB-10046 SS5]
MSTWVYGHAVALATGPAMQALDAWNLEYGDNFVIQGSFGKKVLVTTDLWALTHVLSTSDVFGKSEAERHGLESFLGTEGVLWARGEQHTKQRRILNPAFGHAAIRDVTPVFLEGASRLCELWTNACMAAGGTARLDATEWISKVTQFIIARAAFDYDAHTLSENGETSRMSDAVNALFHADVKPADRMRNLVNNHFPILRMFLPNEGSRLAADCRSSLHDVGKEIVNDRKAAVIAESSSLERPHAGGKDLMSLLLRANMADDLEPTLRLSDAELLAQIPTFLIAGYESASTTVSWALYTLATSPDIQTRLRDEIQQLPTETPTLDMMNSLQYLDWVVRETLRLYSFVTYISREAFKEDHIPLERPAKGRKGNSLSHIHIQPGDEVMIPMWLVNRSQRIWGPDANQFRPERWENLPDEAAAIPGVMPGHLTFSGGPRGCIGHRFAVAEMKALLFRVVRGFELRLAVEPDEIWVRSGPLLHQRLRRDNTVQLPILITPVC